MSEAKKKRLLEEFKILYDFMTDNFLDDKVNQSILCRLDEIKLECGTDRDYSNLNFYDKALLLLLKP
jgi:hypothetical protein